MSSRVDYEGELAVVIKKKAYRLGRRDDRSRTTSWATPVSTTSRPATSRTRTSSSPGPSPSTRSPRSGRASPRASTRRGLEIKTFLNGKLRQSSNTRHLIFPVPFLVRFISNIMTLLPGDIITTGTPAGVGPMQPGDRVDVQIEGIGTLSNQVLNR